jgi:hypothetical protein
VHLERHPDFHVGSGLIVVGTMAAMERIFGHEQGRSQFPVLRNQIRMPRMSAGPQAETRKKKQDCFVANAVRLREVARGNQPFDVGGREIARQPRQSLLWDGRNGPIEPWV